MPGKLHALQTLGVRLPIMQAGMPGVANVDLAAAVSRAGGIGTLGLQDISTWERSLCEVRAAANGTPVSVNLLLPYTRKKHVDAIVRQHIPIVTLFWGDARELISHLHHEDIFVFQQVGSKSEAARALDAGVDAIIAQGTEAGGHVRGKLELADLLPQVVNLAGATPVFAAGGIYCADDVRGVVALGASGVSTGTRFLLTHESNAHEAYKRRLLEPGQTILTTLFGLGWPTPHRVLQNEATRRWCHVDGSIPTWLQAFNSAFAFTRKLIPFKADAAKLQRPDLPIFSPAWLEKSFPASLVECTALYAGEHVGRIKDILPARDVVEDLARGFHG